MRYTQRVLLSLAAFIPFFTFADASNAKHENQANKPFPYKEAPANRLFIGPDLYYQERSVGHYGLDFGYEYKKSDFVYGRFDIDTTWGNFDSDKYNFNVEGKLGYSFSPRLGLDVIPYMGFGYYQLNVEDTIFRWSASSNTYQQYNGQAKFTWDYPLLGCLINYAVNNVFEIGFNVKFMYAFNTKVSTPAYRYGSNRTQSIGSSFQSSFEFPLTFYLNTQKTCDLRLVPYYVDRNLGDSSWNWGDDCVVSESLYQAGGRIEVGFHF